MTKAQLEANARNKFLDLIRKMVDEQMDIAPLDVSANEISVPCLDDEGNEIFVTIKVAVPRGARDGKGGYIPYNGYKLAEDYKDDCNDRMQKKAKAEQNKQAKIAKDQKRRAEKAALAEANKNLKELRKVQITPEKE